MVYIVGEEGLDGIICNSLGGHCIHKCKYFVLHNKYLYRSSKLWTSFLSNIEWHRLNKANTGSNRSLSASQSGIR